MAATAQDSVVEDSKPNARPWVKAFVVFHLIAITIWALPNPPEEYLTTPPKLQVALDTSNPSAFAASLARTLTDGVLLWNWRYGKTSFFRYYTLGTGFWQYWDMFAPNPVTRDIYGTADVTYADGTTAIYEYPRIYKLNLVDKYLKERYRKFFERANLDYFSYCWPPFAHRVALLMTKEKSNPVASVTLHRHFLSLPPPGQPIPTAYQDEAYFRATLVSGQWHYFIHQNDKWPEVGFE